MSTKKSTRFYNDRRIRAVWSDEENKWFFSATDIVRAINDEPDYVKAGNYWRWLKKKLSATGVQLVSGTHDFKNQRPRVVHERNRLFLLLRTVGELID